MNEHQDANSTAIAWRDWNEETFLAARAEAKPVLLTLGATWCHWCHVMDQTSYSDQRVIELVNSRFIPVRVDVDQRPDIALRYNQGGYPSVAFLTGDGQFLAGRPYTSPDEMAALLAQVANGELVQPAEGARTAITSPGDGSGGPVAAVAKRLTELYDEEFGGFGVEPKQPPWEALRFFNARYGLTGDRFLLKMAETTLQGMWHGIYDRKDQGFFRYSVSRDWKVPHYEKMLVSNANLLLTYLEAYQVTRKRDYRAAAQGTLDYMLTTLFSTNDGLFFASQDADEPYYQMSWKDRAAAGPPPVDRTFYAGWNALAAHALIEAAGVLGRPHYRRVAAAILENLWRENWNPSGGLSRIAGGAQDVTPILSDQVHFLRAWLARYQASAQPDALHRAVEVAGSVQRLFGAADGGCFDTAPPQSFESSLLPRERPALDNGHWAEALLTLSHLTEDGEYAKQAAGASENLRGGSAGEELPGRPAVPPHGGGRRSAVPACRLGLGAGPGYAGPGAGEAGAGGRFRLAGLPPAAPGSPANLRPPPGSPAAGLAAGRGTNRPAGFSAAAGSSPLCLHGRPLPGPHHHAPRGPGAGPHPAVGPDLVGRLYCFGQA